jgi:hypothetical protein
VRRFRFATLFFILGALYDLCVNGSTWTRSTILQRFAAQIAMFVFVQVQLISACQVFLPWAYLYAET